MVARAALVEGLRAMVLGLRRIAAEGEAIGMGAEVVHDLRSSLLAPCA